MKTEKFIYFIRHGESEANRANMFQPQDDPLTEHGHAQNEFVAERLARVDFDLLLTSPFLRAVQTAQAIEATTGHELLQSDLWREYVPPSSLLGRSRVSPEGIAYMTARKEHMNEFDWHYEDEENFFDLHERASLALTDLLERPERRIVVVTHLGFLKTVIACMLTHGIPDPDTYVRTRFLFESKNTGITTCRYGTDKKERSGWRLVTWNDFTHLPPELSKLTEAFIVV